MAKSNNDPTQKNPEISCETQAKQRLIKLRLSDIKVEKQVFCHRLGKYDNPKNRAFATFVDQIKRDGCIQVPLEVVRSSDRSADRKWTLIRGHRRVAACLYLAGQNQPGFAADMELEAYEVFDADDKDLLIRSVSDNENRRNLTRAERIQAAYRMVQGRVPVPRAANALGVSEQTFGRDLVIAENDWMFRHFQRGDIKATDASELLKTAIEGDLEAPLPAGQSRLESLRLDFGRWVDQQRKDIDELDARRQAAGKKALRPADKAVHKRLPRFLVQHWLALLKHGRRFAGQEDADWTYSVTLEKDTLRIPSVRLDVKKDNPEKLAKVLAAIASVPEVILPALQLRRDESNQLLTDVDISKGIDLLRTHGLERLAGQIEESRKHRLEAARSHQEARATDGEPAPSADQPPRTEADIRAEIDTEEEDEVAVPDEEDFEEEDEDEGKP